jgi:cell division protein FtsI (penicillin-binding protein 3)
MPASTHQGGALPDLRGFGARDALRELARLGLAARMVGVGVVVEQNPPAGAPVEPGGTCTLVLNRRPLDSSGASAGLDRSRPLDSSGARAQDAPPGPARGRPPSGDQR